MTFLVESPILYLAVFRTIIVALFKTFCLPLRFLPSKADFPSFLAVSTTDKPVNQSIHAYALTELYFFAIRGLSFRDIRKKTRKEF